MEGPPEALYQNPLKKGHIRKAVFKEPLELSRTQNPEVLKGTRRSIGVVVQAVTLAGDLQTARSLVEGDVANLYRHF